MIAIPVSGEAVRRTLRTAAIAAIAVASLAVNLPNVLLSVDPFKPGVFDFVTSANVVTDEQPNAPAAGVNIGDRIDYSRMAPNDRYGSVQDGLRMPPFGKKVPLVVDRQGKRHVAVFSGDVLDLQWDQLMPWTVIERGTLLVLVLLGAALFLIRPAPLTAAFFLFVGGRGSTPWMFYLLSNSGFTAIMLLNDVLLGLGAIGFFLVSLYLDPRRHIRPSLAVGAAALLFAAFIGPIATSDAFELVLGSRPAWPLAGWASFFAVWFCYGAGFALLFRLAASTSAPRSLRFIAALLATAGAFYIISCSAQAWYSEWYFTNLPGATFNRGIIGTRPYPGHMLAWQTWPFAARLVVVTTLSYALLRGPSPDTRSAYFRVASYTWLACVILAVFLPSFSAALPTYLAALLAFYVIIRARVADTGPALSRIAAYIIVALLVVSTLALASIAFVPRSPTYVLTVPIGILVAIGIGYWVSGLRNLAGCLSLACVDAWNAWAKGRVCDERDALTKALGLAERTHQRSVIAEIRAQIAFRSWRDGEDGEFERNVDAVRHLLGGRNMRGIGRFAQAAASGEEPRFDEDDLPEWRARAALVLCTRTNDAARAQQHAADALTSADESALASLQVLGSIAVAETCPARRDASLERAHAIARDAGWPALSKSILTLRANARDIGILQSFVDVRLRKSRPARPLFEVSFFNAELCQNGAHVSLPEKQLELLLAVAAAQTGINDNDVLDALWPESEGDAARNSFRVCLHGLRKNAGDPRIVTRVGKGYVLHPWADVDLWRLRSRISVCRESGGREGAPELRELCDALRAGQPRRATLGDWFYRFEQMLTGKLEEAERLFATAQIRI